MYFLDISSQGKHQHFPQYMNNLEKETSSLALVWQMVGHSQTRIYLKIYNTYCEYWSFKILTVVSSVQKRFDQNENRSPKKTKRWHVSLTIRFFSHSQYLWQAFNILYIYCHLSFLLQVIFSRSTLPFILRSMVLTYMPPVLCVCLFCVLCYKHKHKQTAKFVKATVP